ncbi:hypothetical protein ACFVHI_23415 [Kitasatospora sp. NPDC127121]|uniref:hypothetical protein n=1 Tax=Kitasatospora sp. NPDC127121 TaxID=3345371 RepID=UPI003634BAE5
MDHSRPAELAVGPAAARAARPAAPRADRQLDVLRRAVELTAVAEAVTGPVTGPVTGGRPVPWPREALERSDERGAGAGTEPFDEYTARFAPG